MRNFPERIVHANGWTKVMKDIKKQWYNDGTLRYHRPKAIAYSTTSESLTVTIVPAQRDMRALRALNARRQVVDPRALPHNRTAARSRQRPVVRPSTPFWIPMSPIAPSSADNDPVWEHRSNPIPPFVPVSEPATPVVTTMKPLKQCNKESTVPTRKVHQRNRALKQKAQRDKRGAELSSRLAETRACIQAKQAYNAASKVADRLEAFEIRNNSRSLAIEAARVANFRRSSRKPPDKTSTESDTSTVVMVARNPMSSSTSVSHLWCQVCVQATCVCSSPSLSDSPSNHDIMTNDEVELLLAQWEVTLRQLSSVPSRLAEVILRYRKLLRRNPFRHRHVRWNRNTRRGRQIEFTILHLTAFADLVNETQPSSLEQSFTELQVSPTETNSTSDSSSSFSSTISPPPSLDTSATLPVCFISSRNKIRRVVLGDVQAPIMSRSALESELQCY
jgi:hypothetical protein